jgi:uncharacterized membrane protein YkvA (DUF1232 family)
MSMSADPNHLKRLRRLSLRRRTQLAWRMRRDPRVPITAKLTLLAVIAYVVSPINVIPRWIPVIRRLDNFLIAATGLWVVSKLIPPHLLDEHLNAVEKRRK